MAAFVRSSLLLLLLHLSVPTGDSASILDGWGGISRAGRGAGTRLRQGSLEGLRGGSAWLDNEVEEQDDEWDKEQEKLLVEQYMREGMKVDDAISAARRDMAERKGKPIDEADQVKNETVYHLMDLHGNMSYEESLLKYGVSQEYIDKNKETDKEETKLDDQKKSKGTKLPDYLIKAIERGYNGQDDDWMPLECTELSYATPTGNWRPWNQVEQGPPVCDGYSAAAASGFYPHGYDEHWDAIDHLQQSFPQVWGTPRVIPLRGGDKVEEQDPRDYETMGTRMMEVFEGVPDTSDAQLRFLSQRAGKLCVRGKGLLVMSEAADEMEERFRDTTFYNVAEERRMFRSMLVSHPQMETTVTGVLLHEETVAQNVDRRAFPQYIESRGAMVGVRADRGVAPIPNNGRGETWTVGISDLFERLHTYHTQGVHFASWRSEFRIDGDEMPSEEALVRNTAEIAVFARVALNAGLVPVIEADVLPDGVHSHEVHYDASSLVLRRIIYQLGVHKIPLSAIVFRIQMVQAGKDAPGVERGEDADTPRLTLELLRDCVPSSVPGVYFKSGAFDEEKATAHLDVIGRQADIAKGASGRHTAPWTLSFGFGRDLQMSAMAVWLQSERNATKAGIIAGDVCRVNADAMLGEYGGEHPAAAMQY